jgi:hypothetical protein
MYTFGGQKGENKPAQPKNEIWAPKFVWLCDASIDREFYMEQEKYILGENKPSEPKIGIWARKSVWS